MKSIHISLPHMRLQFRKMGKANSQMSICFSNPLLPATSACPTDILNGCNLEGKVHPVALMAAQIQNTANSKSLMVNLTTKKSQNLRAYLILVPFNVWTWMSNVKYFIPEAMVITKEPY